MDKSIKLIFNKNYLKNKKQLNNFKTKYQFYKQTKTI